MRPSSALAALLAGGIVLWACGPAQEPQPKTPKDETKEPWYGQLVDRLARQNLEIKRLLKAGKPDAASDLIQSGEPLATRLLSVPKPTLSAMQEASDLDEVYGKMLLSNHNYGWARLFFQKNLARWKNWTPRTDDTAARLKTAEDEIAEVDRKLLGP